MENKFKLVSFDIWGTLLKSNPEFVNKRGKFFGEILNQDDLVHLKFVKDEVDIELDGKAETTGEDSDFYTRIKLMIQKLSKNPDDFTEGFFIDARNRLNKIFLDNLPEFINPNTLELFKELKKRDIKIAFVSNTGFVHGDVMRQAFSALGACEFVDYFIFSNEVGVSKPHTGIYSKLVEDSGFLPGEILHIGDSVKADYDGAWKSGITSVLFDPFNKHGERMFSIKNIFEVLEIVDNEKQILHYNNLCLYSLRMDGEKIVTQDEQPFDLISYSKFKYGAGDAAKIYGHNLAEKFIKSYPNIFDNGCELDIIITTSPYKAIVKGSSGIVKGFKNYLNQFLLNQGKNSVVDITILKKEMFEGDYGLFTDEQRKQLMHKNDLFIQEKLIENKKLILIDDARITGSHEGNLVSFLMDKKINEVYFLYVADMELNFAKNHPDIESVMNHGWVDNLDKLSEIMNSKEFILNARVCKYILSKHDESHLKIFLKNLNDHVLYELYNGIVGDGYASMNLYKQTFQLLKGELEARGIIKNNNFTL